MDVKTVAVRLKAEHADYVKGMKASGDSTAAFGKLATGALLAVGTAAAAFALKSADAYVSYGKTIMGLSRISGESIETASRWNFAAQQSGVSAETLSTGIKFLEKNMASGNAEFGKLGVSVTDNNGKLRSSHEVFLETADAISHLSKGAEQTDAILKVFGRSGLALGPLLLKGREGIIALENEAQKYGLVLTADNLPAIQANIKAHRQLDAAMQGAQIQLGQQVLPTLTSAVEFFAKLPGPIAASIAPIGGLALGMVGLTKVTSALGLSMGPAGLAIAAAGAAVILWQQRLADGAKAVESLNSSVAKTTEGAKSMEDLDRINRKTAEGINVLKTEADNVHAPWDVFYKKDLREGTVALQNNAIAQQILAAQVRVYADANHVSQDEALKAIQAEREKNNAVKESGEGAALTTEKIQAMTDAVRGLNDAERAAFDPQFAMTDATNRLGEAQEKARESQWATVVALKAYNDAVLIYGPNSAAATDAAWKLHEAQAAQTASTNDVAKANIDVDVATRNLTNAMLTNKVSLEDNKATLDGWVAQGRMTREQADLVVYGLWLMQQKAAELDGKHIVMGVEVETSSAFAKLRDLWAQIDATKARIDPNFGKTGLGFGIGAQLDAIRAQKAAGHADGSPLSEGWNIINEQGPEALYKSGSHVSVMTAGQTAKWGAWGAGRQVYEDGSFQGMSPSEKAALAFAKAVQRQDAMRAHPELVGRPGWGARDPFAGWDPRADFSKWGKPMGPADGRSGSSSGSVHYHTNTVTIQAPLGVDVDSTVRIIHRKLRDLENSWEGRN